ncbi:MAG: phosphatase PAP2 family protein [Nitrospirae bacterium]|nr:phosphatase PAP2 family protein [Nitrospirota bacterium]
MRKLFFIALALTLILDSSVREVVARWEAPDLHWAMGWLSYLGQGWIQAIPCFILILIGRFVKGDARMEESGKRGIYALVAAGILVQAIKHLIGRPRPEVMEAMGLSLGPSLASGFDSFPSGHATSAFALASTLTTFYPKARYPLYAYSILVGLSRLYLDAHFFSDVFAGLILGLWIGRVVTTKSMEDIKGMFKGQGMALGIAALSVLLFFFQLGGPSLFDVDEAVYAESAREMVTTGDWITPQYNYANRYDKPVLFYWLISSAYKLFGVSEFAARFWSAVFGCGIVVMSYYFLCRVGERRWGVLSAIILATSLEVILLSHAAITDMTLALFMTASLFCLFLGHTAGEGSAKRGWYWGLYLNMALAVLTKGPVGIVIPGLVIILFLFYTGRIREGLREMSLFSGGAIFLLVALPWYVIEIGINGWEYIDAFFIKHNFTRYTGVVSGHGAPIYYFIPVILLAFFPWSAFLPYSLIKSFRVVRSKGNLTHKDQAVLFASLWFLTVFVFFSISKTKLPGYILPLSPAIAILVGWLWDEYSSSAVSDRNRWMGFSISLFAILGLLISVSLFLTPAFLEGSKRLPKFLDGPLEGLSALYIMAGALMIGTILSLLMLWKRRKVLAFGVMAFMMIFVAYILLARIVPVADQNLQSALKDFAKTAGVRLETAGGDLIVYGLNKPSIVFYARRPVIVLSSNQRERLNEVITSSKRFYLITKGSDIEGLLSRPDLYLIDQKRGYALLSNQPPQAYLTEDAGRRKES